MKEDMKEVPYEKLDCTGCKNLCTNRAGVSYTFCLLKRNIFAGRCEDFKDSNGGE